MMRGDQVRVDGQTEYAQTVVEVVLPDRSVPLGRPAFEHFRAPDVVDEHVDVAVVFADPIGQ
jgi:hypothetical protein